ncbi:glycosyltransferase family 2 protein [Leptolyngbya iicbica]|uniref:Glycosyltransferase family 2 protein n=2 Tax=Cyanophyceae TaxID=3028117 RepID=A0A4Q7E333_9CYAN|nr:glycosyltransferase family 2 protein [Leptolyngbya sp. LK]RZM76106.1 glycosyltransferase family 2 protein [Leptolyngbya sp. LK]
MKPSLALFAEPVLVSARRLCWLSFWLLLAPMGVYVFSLNRGQTLVLLQLSLLVVAVIGLGVVNGETAGVLYRHRRSGTGQSRGFIQQLLSQVTRSKPGSARRIKDHQPDAIASLPFVSVVIAAYLPNEQDIIEETLHHWLTQVVSPEAGWEVILAYNTPHPLPVEARLRQLAHQYPDLVLLPVAHSRSKAENLNAALQQVRGEMTCIFDADHHPAANCLTLAWKWLGQGQYDGVQGRNIIRNARDNWLTQLVAVEFECAYGVSHYGRSLLADTALFGGSNGYWRTAALRELGFSPKKLTEDIDVTVRGLLKGYRLVHDPAIITTELAPTHLRGLWLQRQRWSQGWLEVAWIYTGRVARSPYLDPVQKTYWLMMLLFSQGFYPLVWQVVPLMLSIHLSMSDRDLTFENLNLIMMGLLTVSVMFQVALAMQLRPASCSYSRRHGVLYCILSPVYFWLKVLIGMVSLYNHFCGSRVWHVTARTPTLPTKGGLGLKPAKKAYSIKSR